jgi:hypothetical protein
MSKLDEYLGQPSSRTPTPQELWARTKLMANSVADVDNGMEEVMQDIATLVDNYVPTGERWHQDLIDQLATAVQEVRPPVLDEPLQTQLTELKGFRHLVRHSYGAELNADRVDENYSRMRDAFPDFVEAVAQLDWEMAETAGSQDPDPGQRK